MNVHVGMLYMPRPAIGGVGLAYRAWNSVVFLLLAGIAKPSVSVKNERTSRFFVYVCGDERNGS